MKILFLSRKPDVHAMRRLSACALDRGHDVLILDPEDPDLPKTPADLIWPRFGSWRFEESLAALEYFERKRRLVLERSAPLRDARNKWISYLILREEGLPVPSTQFLPRSQWPKSFPYVIKEPESAKGEGVFLIDSAEALLAHGSDGEWVVQEFISEAKNRDHRLLVGPQGLIAAMEREAPPGDFRANWSRGGSVHEYTPGKLEIDTAMAAREALNLRVAGVDLIPSHRGPLVLEVNACPGFEGLEKASGVDVATAMVEIAEAFVAGASK